MALVLENGSNVKLIDCVFDDVDVAVELINSTDVEIRNTTVTGRAVVKGKYSRGLLFSGIEHTYRPSRTHISLAVQRAIYGNV